MVPFYFPGLCGTPDYIVTSKVLELGTANMRRLPIWVWITSLRIVFSSSIRLPVCFMSLLFFSAEWYFIVYMWHIFIICPSAEGHLGCFCFLLLWKCNHEHGWASISGVRYALETDSQTLGLSDTPCPLKFPFLEVCGVFVLANSPFVLLPLFLHACGDASVDRLSAL